VEKALVIDEKPYSIRFKLSSVPPSVNSLYNVIFSLKKVVLKPEVMLWKSQSKMMVPKWSPKVIGKSGFLYLKLDVYTKLYCKNGQVRKFDVTNMEKATIDMVCEKIGIDDKFISECQARKIDFGGDEYMEVEVGFVD
jgi:hypothetical protein